MRIGLGIFLLVVGAVLAFAVRDNIEAVDLTMVGYICMAAGLLAVVLSLVLQAQRTNTTHRQVVDQPGDGEPPAAPRR